MALQLTKPFINSVISFNSANPTTIPLNVLGGGEITAYQFYISTTNNVQIYPNPIGIQPLPISVNDIETSDIRTFNMLITPAMGLLNNTSYYITAKTYNTNLGIESELSNQQFFSCYTTPKIDLFYYKDLVDEFPLINGTIIENDKIYMLLVFDAKGSANDYNSPAKLNTAEIELYGKRISGGEDIIFKGKTLYNSPLQQTVTGLTITNDRESIYESYNIVVVGTTVEGLVFKELVTGIKCEYKQITNSPFLKVTNVCSKGYIEVESKLADYIGESNPNPPIYISGGGVNVINQNSFIQWLDYFNLNEEYTNRWWGSNFMHNQVIIQLFTTNSTNNVEIKYMENDGRTYLTLTCNLGNSFPYYIESNKILSSEILRSTKLFIGVQYSFGLWEIGFEKL